MEVHFWQTKTTSKMPFLFLFLISSCQKADQNWVTEYEIQKYFEIDECNDVIKVVGSYYNQERAGSNLAAKVMCESTCAVVHLSSIIFHQSSFKSDNFLSFFLFCLTYYLQIAGRVYSREERAVINSWKLPTTGNNTITITFMNIILRGCFQLLMTARSSRE